MVILPAAVLRDMIAHAIAEAPRECCGLLVGEGWAVDESIRTTNLAPGTTRYLVDPAEHVALLKHLRTGSRDVIGGYHSHPRSPAWPSPSDMAEAFSAHFVYVIVSLADPAAPVVRAFRIDGGGVTPLNIV
ncbi:MAG: M67 family metallopeptidase [Vicinamibacterales bacterium]